MDHLDVQQASKEHFGRIHRAALVLTGNPWDADDLAQETFLVLAHRPHAFEGRSGLYTWLYGILLNLERRRLRREGLRKRKLRVLWDSEVPVRRISPAAETAIEVAEWKESLWSEVAKLPVGQRQALVLRYSEQLSYDEIAAVLGCPLGTVKSRIHHGLAALKDLLATDQRHLGPLGRQRWEDVTHAV